LFGCWPSAPKAPDQQVAQLLAGTFDNKAQFAAADPAIRTAPAIGSLWLDGQIARFWRIEAPKLPGTAVYLEWRSDTANGPISRQRVWSFRLDPDGSVRMDFYAFRKPQDWAGLGAQANGFARLSPDDLIAYPPSCAALFRKTGKDWTGRIDPAQCRITTQTGRVMALDVTIRIGSKGLVYQETGVLPDGALAFKVPSATAYQFVRHSD
jgi:CpeT/CpcT family (DUF1001)